MPLAGSDATSIEFCGASIARSFHPARTFCRPAPTHPSFHPPAPLCAVCEIFFLLFIHGVIILFPRPIYPTTAASSGFASEPVSLTQTSTRACKPRIRLWVTPSSFPLFLSFLPSRFPFCCLCGCCCAGRLSVRARDSAPSTRWSGVPTVAAVDCVCTNRPPSAVFAAGCARHGDQNRRREGREEKKSSGGRGVVTCLCHVCLSCASSI